MGVVFNPHRLLQDDLDLGYSSRQDSTEHMYPVGQLEQDHDVGLDGGKPHELPRGAENRHFWPFSARRAHTKTLRGEALLWETLAVG